MSPKFAGFVRQERVGVLPNFLEAARTEKLEALHVLALTTGMRQGELLSLKWEDIDLEAGTLHIRRTLSTAMGEGFSFNPPKTAKSRRSIKVPKLALQTLRRHRVVQLEERMKAGDSWKDHDLVFTTGVGTPISKADLITRSFGRPAYPTYAFMTFGIPARPCCLAKECMSNSCRSSWVTPL